MSIMRDTYLMKQNGKYAVYHIGSFTFPSDWTDAAKEKKQSVFDLMKKTPEWGKPFATGFTDKEATEIADADHSIDDGNAGYSKYAGDSVYLIDMDNQKAFYRKRNKTADFDTKDRKTTPYFTGGAWEDMK
jgi:hypothetical protein